MCNDLLCAYFDVFYHIRPVVSRRRAERALDEVFQLQGLAEPRTVDGVTDAAACFDSIVSRSPSPSFLNWNVVGVLLAMFALAAYTAPQLLDATLSKSRAGVALAERYPRFCAQNAKSCWPLLATVQSSLKARRIRSPLTVLLLYGSYRLRAVQ